VRLVLLDPASAVPPFEQLRSQLAAAIESGELPPASQLPTVRWLAGDLGLAANTVARAYRELELAGLIEGRGRHGTFVAGKPSAERRLAARAAREFSDRMRALGIGEAEILAILRRELERASGESSGGPEARTRPGRGSDKPGEPGP
jgi:DNA-binding transcriptional regulator YhcF (GntR family)